MANSVGEVARVFLKLGLTSFGGPVAHLGYFHRELVEKRNWIDAKAFGDLVALCQFLPGPASSQAAFALGMHRAGIWGAIVASFCFTMPSALLMIAFAYGVARVNVAEAGWVHGLKLAAVAVVAQAVWAMGRKLCPDRFRQILCLLFAAILLAVSSAWLQVALIAAGAIVGWIVYRHENQQVELPPPEQFHSHKIASIVLGTFLVLLLMLPWLARVSGNRWIAEFEVFYRSGSLVFGGGHVVLPLLQSDIVPRGWLANDAFLAGYGAAQAIPGPLFTFSAYLGTAMHLGSHAWIHGLWCLLAIFLPAWLLIGGAIPFWQRLRGRSWAQAGLKGANAAVVGVLLAALYQPVIATAVRGPRDVALAIVGFGMLQLANAPSWLVVLILAAAGEWIVR